MTLTRHTALVLSASFTLFASSHHPPCSGPASALCGVDVSLGTAAPGNTFIGAQVPFGFAAPGPDTLTPTNSGYRVRQPIVGFSMTHVSGTGGAGMYGNFRVSPGISGVASGPSVGVDEHAAPGYYSVVLDPSDVRVELTAARLAALERFTYPSSSRATLTVDAASFIATSYPGAAVPHGVWVRATGPRSFEGGADFVGGGSVSYRLYFSAQVDRPVRLRVATDRTAIMALFDARQDRTLILRIGVSFTSAATARRHLAELPGFDFDAARRNAQARWRAALGEITVAGGTAQQRQLFATAFYHTHLMPHDVTGDGRWPSGQPHYEDFFTLWDTFRTVDPLLEVTDPHRLAAMVNSLVTTYRVTGWLPDARVAGHDGVTQVGSSGDVLVADALMKGIGGIDYRTAYEALRKDAEVDSPDHWSYGRMLSDWNRLHYVGLDEDRSASRTLEYAYDDFAVAEVAQRLGHAREAARYRTQAGYWANLWDPSTQSIRPRNPDGSYLYPFAPTAYTVSAAFFEGSALEWSTFVPHDVQGLINRIGGDQAFVRWLNHVMACCYDAGNEPDLLAPWLYIHAGRPDLTDAAVRRLLATEYHGGTAGLPGNDDAGTLSAWYVWSAIGLYPNAGQPYYYIGAPIFTRAHIALGNGRSFTVEAPAASAANQYVVGATLNHRALSRAFLMSDELERGGTLVLSMSRHPNGWGTEQRPFSLSSAPSR